MIDKPALAFAGALALAAAPPAAAQVEPAPPARAQADADAAAPVILQADELRGRPDIDTEARGDVELQRGALTLRADRLRYDHARELARAEGSVRILREGNVYTGREMQLQVQTLQGYVLDPTFFFARTGAGGSAERIDFLGEDRLRALRATYTSCPADGSGGPDWLLESRRVTLDFAANEGRAEGAVLRFLGVPILGAPLLSFPLSDDRKSGWLPPDINLDSKSGFELSVPYYWNLAPNRDATLAPAIVSRRGVALDAEFRYLDLDYRGQTDLHLLPNDRAADRDRHALRLRHQHRLPYDSRFALQAQRVSDDAYWKDFPRVVDSLTPRLLSQQASLARDWKTRRIGDAALYVRVQQWQVLRDPDPAAAIVAPYQRAPQLGVRVARPLGDGGLQLDAEAEYNRFSLPSGEPQRETGERWHAIGALSWPVRRAAGFVVPKLALNSARYRIDEPVGPTQQRSRSIPTASVDAGLVFERDSLWFGHELRQTLEPRLLYVLTPFREQRDIPLFDSAPKDFNFDTIYTENAFSGIDRVSDARQLTAGVTTRLFDPATGAEKLRLGLVQRYLFRDQRVTPDDGPPLTRRLSDVLLLGSTQLVPRWHLDASLQYSPDNDRTVRSLLGARYSPGPFRTVSMRYRLARALTEQVELAWQWPVAGEPPADPQRPRASPLLRALGGDRPGERCSGSWYSVGRLNYSTRESRIIDALLGVEYDAGCWIGRIVADRLSTGRSEATTRLLLQLELVGLSRLGSNPLSVLRDNIPGYRLLREDRAGPVALPSDD